MARSNNTNLIEVCPECSTSRIYRRKPSLRSSIPADSEMPPYRCMDCTHNFDEPEFRPKENHGNVYPESQRRLLDADPEDYPR